MQAIQRFFTSFSDTFRKQGVLGKIVLASVTLFILCCLCSIPIAILSPSKPSSEVASTPMDVSGIQTVAFNTAVAGVNQTATANAPTNTPEPTNTSTPEPTLTLDVPADPYLVALGEKVSEYVEALLDVNEFVQQAGNDPSLILDSDWKTKIGFALGILNFRAEEMAKLEPSPNYVDLHSIIVKLADETYLFTDSYANGIDNLDSAMIEKASQHLMNMTTFMQEATTEMDRIKSAP